MSNTKVRSILADQLEITVDSKGIGSISYRGAGELLGVPKSTAFDRLKALREGVRVLGGVNAETLVAVDQNVSGKITDIDFTLLLNWYAVEAPRGRTKEAKDYIKFTSTIGVRGHWQAEAGHDGSVQELVQSVKIDRSLEEALREQVQELSGKLGKHFLENDSRDVYIEQLELANRGFSDLYQKQLQKIKALEGKPEGAFELIRAVVSHEIAKLRFDGKGQEFPGWRSLYRQEREVANQCTEAWLAYLLTL